ncbi:unnamed protein product [Pleuronectes platessa]|uniref:Uncharacterized protein n=1 Tax=Pleuronectes platessa TaxID=8262 RepID=A0A9N7YP26_PLEPL|nr:unnamed protein product [Pleuronectes platessa]
MADSNRGLLMILPLGCPDQTKQRADNCFPSSPPSLPSTQPSSASSALSLPSAANRLLEWAADCCGVEEEEGGEDKDESQLPRRKLFKVETKHQVLPELSLLHNNMLELVQSVQSASKETGKTALPLVPPLFLISPGGLMDSDEELEKYETLSVQLNLLLQE